MHARLYHTLALLLVGICVHVVPAYSQNSPQPAAQEETLAGPDTHGTTLGLHGYLFGDWGGTRSRLLARGVRFDFQYVSDSLGNVASSKAAHFSVWNRVRSTVDIDFAQLTGASGLHFHATGLWQGGGKLVSHLGLLTSPSGMSSEHTFRLDSWWVEKRWSDERLTVRAGQFAGQDFYGAQHYAASFIFEPMGYALGNLFTTIESFDPPSTPAVEVRVVPKRDMYIKSMVLAGDPDPFSHNPSGFVPQFRGHPVTVAEFGFTPGTNATAVRAFDSVASRKGYSGLYQIGASYNPGTFTTQDQVQHSGNYLVYLMASQALWRVDPKGARGLDATVAWDWSPGDINRNNTLFTAGLRYNEPLPLPFHNTLSLGYIQNRLSQRFVPHGGLPFHPEHALEINAMLTILPMMFVQPVVQTYANNGGRTGHAVVIGFRTKIEF
jgi:porin